MTRIVETTRIAEGPDALWKDIGPFGAVGEWHPLLSRVESEASTGVLSAQPKARTAVDRSND